MYQFQAKSMFRIFGGIIDILPAVAFLMLVFGCSNPNPLATSTKIATANEFEELRGADMVRAIEMYRDGNVDEGRILLRQLVADKNWNVRSNAIRTIWEVNDKVLLPEIYAALKDKRLEVRESASRALQFIGDQTSLPYLKSALLDPEPIVRCNAVEALGKLAGASTVGILNNILKTDIDLTVRATTARTLGSIHQEDAIPGLINALNDDSFAVRSEAALALGEIGDSSSIPALEKAAEDPNIQVRNSAKNALKKLLNR